MYSYKVRRIGSSTWILKRYKEENGEKIQLKDGKKHVRPEHCEREGRDWLWSINLRKKTIGVN